MNTEKLKRGRKQKGRYQRGMNSPILHEAFAYEGKYAVYALASEDKPHQLYYVGQTRSALNTRYSNHLKQARGSATPKERWVHQLLTEGKKLLMIVLEEGIPTLDEACEREQYYIGTLRTEGHPLTNVTRGGKGTPGRVVSKASKLKASNSMKQKGIVVSLETRQKMSVSSQKAHQRRKAA
jgi:predicted GIY-YIG superfamily endonuclease